MEMETIDQDSTVELSKDNAALLKRLSPRLSLEEDATFNGTFQSLGIESANGAICNQRGGLFLLNDGKEVSTDIWSRFSLMTSKPIDAFSLQQITKILLETPGARESIREAEIIIAPQSAGPEVLRAIAQEEQNLLKGKKILKPSPRRQWNEKREASISLSEIDIEMLSSCITPGANIAIIDDVGSSFRTSSRIAAIAKEKGAANVTFLALVCINPKDQFREEIKNSGIKKIYAGVVTGYAGGDEWKIPKIANTRGLFESSEKGDYRRKNIISNLPDDGIALRVIQKRVEGKLRLLFIDLDGTLIEQNKAQPELFAAIKDIRQKVFSVVATGRSQNSFFDLPEEIRSLFDAGILEGGMRVCIGNNVSRSKTSRSNPQEVRTLIERTTRKIKAFGIVTQTSPREDFPWWVRIRTKKTDLHDENWKADDTEAALRFAETISNGRIEASASGYGDVLIAPTGINKGTSGLAELARRIPSLPNLKDAIAIGDGPNDIVLLKKVADAGGLSIAVNPLNEDVKAAATRSMDHISLAKLLRDMLL